LLSHHAALRQKFGKPAHFDEFHDFTPSTQSIPAQLSTFRNPPITVIETQQHKDTFGREVVESMADAVASGAPLKEVQIEALVVMRIIKHSTSTFPVPATGCLVGMDVPSASGTQLQVTNCFQFPASVPEQPQDQFYPTDAATLAAAAPRAKSNVAYQNEMIKMLREVNVDAQNVGWYGEPVLLPEGGG
jgi:hypothetical protein